MTRPDPDRPLRVLGFIQSYFESNGYWPSVREIGRGVGLASTSATANVLDTLEAAGCIERGPKSRARSLTITPEGYDVLATPKLRRVG